MKVKQLPFVISAIVMSVFIFDTPLNAKNLEPDIDINKRELDNPYGVGDIHITPTLKQPGFLPSLSLFSKHDSQDLPTPGFDLNTSFPREGKYKTLVLMVNLSEHPFKVESTPQHYSDLMFGDSPDSVSSYIKHQSNGKFELSPITLPNQSAPGVLKINVDSKKYDAITSSEMAKLHSDIVDPILDETLKRIDLSGLDVNGDKMFDDSWMLDSNDAPPEELMVYIVLSGNSQDGKEPATKIQAHPHAFVYPSDSKPRKMNGYTVNTIPVVTMSELMSGFSVGQSIMAHEILHTVNTKDMYVDETSIGPWSIMHDSYGSRDLTGGIDFDANPLDPFHKLRLGWIKPQTIQASQTPKVLKDDDTKAYVLNHPKDKNIYYVIEYRDFENDYYEKSNFGYGMTAPGVIVWRVDKSRLRVDWNLSYNGTSYSYDGFINTVDPPEKSLKVLTNGNVSQIEPSNSLIPIGSKKVIEDTGIELEVVQGGFKLKSDSVGENNEPTLIAIDRTIKQYSKFNPKEGVVAQAPDGTDISDLVKVERNTVNTQIPGSYIVEYKLEYQGHTITKTITVIVEAVDSKYDPPVINASDRVIPINSNFNPLEGVTATGHNGSNLTNLIEVTNGNFDTSKPGPNQVIYSVTDPVSNMTATKKIIVTVAGNSTETPTDNVPPMLKGVEDKVLQKGSKFNNREGVTATDNVDGNITDRIKITYDDVETDKEGRYLVRYEVSDLAGNKTTRNRTIEIVDNIRPPEKDTTAPIITLSSSQVNIPKGYKFNPKIYATAKDNKDGNITDKIVIRSNVNVNVPGNYNVVYEVSDLAGNKSNAVLKVKVYNSSVNFHIPHVEVKVGSNFDPKANITITDSLGNDILDSTEVIMNDFDINSVGQYTIVYRVKDDYGNYSTYNRIVRVVDEVTELVPPQVLYNVSTLVLGEQFRATDGMVVKDYENQDITHKVQHIEGELDTNAIGKYTLKYKLPGERSYLDDFEFTRDIWVTDKPVTSGAPQIFLNTTRIEKDSEFHPKDTLEVFDREDGELTYKTNVVENNVDTSQIGSYTVTYSVVDKDSNVSDATFTIEVVDKIEIPDLPIVDDNTNNTENPSNPGDNTDNNENTGDNGNNKNPGDSTGEIEKPSSPGDNGESNVKPPNTEDNGNIEGETNKPNSNTGTQPNTPPVNVGNSTSDNNYQVPPSNTPNYPNSNITTIPKTGSTQTYIVAVGTVFIVTLIFKFRRKK